ncbi:MAG: PilZ domain-containing protein, partial [Candidatus Omnitrophota bacterium]
TRGKVLRFDTRKTKKKFHDESGLDFTPDDVSIICSKTLPVESKIQIKMLIPDAKGLNLIKANGTVKWVKQVKGKYKKYFVIGVNFRDLAESDRKKLVSLWKKYRTD